MTKYILFVCNGLFIIDSGRDLWIEKVTPFTEIVWNLVDFSKRKIRVSVTEKYVAYLHGNPNVLHDTVVFIRQLKWVYGPCKVGM